MRLPVKRILVLLCAAGASVSAEWTVLENCRLIESLSNDADSFVAECSEPFRGETQNRFRLYFVDAAETDMNSEFKQKRLAEQADYWGSDDPGFALQTGLRAAQTVKKLLRSRFTVYTQGEYAPTLGAPRYYALIRLQDRWLDEILVEEGLVRIYGKGTDLPDHRDEKSHWNSLHSLERAARARRVNGWSRSAEEPEEPGAFVPYDTVSARDAWIYSVKSGKKVTVIPGGTSVSVLAEADSGRLRIRFEKDGKVYEGLCTKGSLTP
jgi:endonuclease YncB( thermonuclease family)